MRHANISVTLNVYAQAITQTKRDAQSRVVSLLLDKNEEKPSTEAYRTVTDLQNSGGDLQVVDKVGVPDGTTLHRLVHTRAALYAACTVFEPA
jgi:hypothetical protein